MPVGLSFHGLDALSLSYLKISWQKMERKKIKENIAPSFSAVTNIKRWRVKAALSYAVSLV